MTNIVIKIRASNIFNNNIRGSAALLDIKLSSKNLKEMMNLISKNNNINYYIFESMLISMRRTMDKLSNTNLNNFSDFLDKDSIKSFNNRIIKIKNNSAYKKIRITANIILHPNLKITKNLIKKLNNCSIEIYDGPKAKYEDFKIIGKGVQTHIENITDHENVKKIFGEILNIVNEIWGKYLVKMRKDGIINKNDIKIF